jgi:hypothetical protein
MVEGVVHKQRFCVLLKCKTNVTDGSTNFAVVVLPRQKKRKRKLKKIGRESKLKKRQGKQAEEERQRKQAE